MEKPGAAEFPGFQIGVHKDELVFKRPLSRLQRHAPYPLQVKPNVSVERKGAAQAMECSSTTLNSAAAAATSATSSSSFSSLMYQRKDPILLLSPLVLPSFLESSYLHQSGNTAK